MTKCADKDKQTLSAYGIKGEEKTSSTYENKEQARYGYVRIYECGLKKFTSTFECACAAQETAISQIK